MQELDTYKDLKMQMHMAFLDIIKIEHKMTKPQFLAITDLCKSNGGAYYDAKKIPSPQKIEDLCKKVNVPYKKVVELYAQRVLNLNQSKS